MNSQMKRTWGEVWRMEMWSWGAPPTWKLLEPHVIGIFMEAHLMGMTDY